ncbi:Holliday junction resolvase Hjc [Candidatus Gugararchaeum adminiculabundum]|nr:Holliday junction resolvase Hjc [Candidatus Gugararchaeum adminiculabundum]
MAAPKYAKGARNERELMELFSQKGYALIRAAGSGVGYACPDFLAFKHGRQYGFECKAWDSSSIAIRKDKFAELKRWEELTGITTMIAWKLSRKGWRFFYLSELNEADKNFTMTETKAEIIDRKIYELA